MELERFGLPDKERVLEIFHSNTPNYYDLSEEAPFIEFLQRELPTYYTCKVGGKIISAGGFMKQEEGEARICWIMVDALYHGKGTGRFMLEQFEKQIRKDNQYQRITLKTTQFVNEFYKKLNYKTTYFEEDFWEKGWHLHFMEKEA